MNKQFMKFYEVIAIGLIFCVAWVGVLNMDRSPIRLLSVVSGSMEPAIGTGSLILVVRQSEYESDDIVTYTLGKQLVTHRVIYAHNYYLTKGDANKLIDLQSVAREQIIGKVWLVIPYGGYLRESVKNVYGLLGFIIFPALLIIGHELIIIGREVARFEEKKEGTSL